MNKNLALALVGILIGPSLLLAGSPFEEPSAKVTVKTVQSGAPVKSSNGPAATVVTPAVAPDAAYGSYYTVVSGDSLSKIAARLLGNPRRYWEIVELNKARYPSLAKNPNLIYPGWKLFIPTRGISALPPEAGTSGATGSTTSGSSTGTTTGGIPTPTYPAVKGGINTRSADFKTWLKEAMSYSSGWNFPENVTNKYGQVISREDFFKAILTIESSGVHQKADGKILTSSCGALGFMQLMPATARSLGVDPKDPRQNLIGGAKFLKECFSGPCTKNPNDTPADRMIKAACGYNRGPYAKLLKSATLPEYVRTCTVTENVRYSIRMKMCLGLPLNADDRNWAGKHLNLSGAALDREADVYYKKSRGIVP